MTTSQPEDLAVVNSHLASLPLVRLIEASIRAVMPGDRPTEKLLQKVEKGW
jgi:hypothetical protein